MIKNIIDWLIRNLTFSQAFCYGMGTFLILLGLGLNLNEVVNENWELHMLSIQDWILFGFGILLVLVAVIKNGTKGRHREIIETLNEIKARAKKIDDRVSKLENKKKK